MYRCVQTTKADTWQAVDLGQSDFSNLTCITAADVEAVIKSLDHNNLNNYRPVSNLPFFSKVIEHIVSNKLIKHLSKSGESFKFQSTYTKYCSTEIALTRITNDIHSL